MDILSNLLKAQCDMAEWKFLPSLLHLHESHVKLSSWCHVIPPAEVGMYHLILNLACRQINSVGNCVVPGNIHNPTMEGFFICTPTPPEIPIKLHTVLLTLLLLPPPSLLEFPLTFCGGGMNIFWNCTGLQRDLNP